MPVTVRWQGKGRCKLPGATLRTRGERMMRALGMSADELSIVLCDDKTIHALNRDYRGKDKPTDVLAFAMREGRDARFAGPMLGDVIISLDTAGRQAKERRYALLDEVTMLLAHGLLHLLGFDHPNRREERRMTARTDMLVAAARARSRSVDKV